MLQSPISSHPFQMVDWMPFSPSRTRHHFHLSCGTCSFLVVPVREFRVSGMLSKHSPCEPSDLYRLDCIFLKAQCLHMISFLLQTELFYYGLRTSVLAFHNMEDYIKANNETWCLCVQHRMIPSVLNPMFWNSLFKRWLHFSFITKVVMQTSPSTCDTAPNTNRTRVTQDEKPFFKYL